MPVGFEFGEGNAAFGGRRTLHQRAQSDQPAFAGDPGSGAVHDNAENPGDEARTLLEASNPGKHREPRILHDLLRLGVAADDRRREAYERGVETANQHSVGHGIAQTQARQELWIVELGRAHRAWWTPLDLALTRMIWSPGGGMGGKSDTVQIQAADVYSVSPVIKRGHRAEMS